MAQILRLREDGYMEVSMTENDYARTLDELDSLLNDPDVPMQPSLIWSLLDKVSDAARQQSWPVSDT